MCIHSRPHSERQRPTTLAIIRFGGWHRTAKQTHNANVRRRCSRRHNSHARVETHAHEVVLVWRDSRTCHLPTQPELGGPTQLASNRSCTECPAAQEHSGWCVAFFWRADSILKSSGFASN